MTLTRRELLAGGAAMLMLNDSAFGKLNGNRVAPWRPPSPTSFEAQDWTYGVPMWEGGYADCPYMVALGDGVLLSTLTVSDGHEGNDDQHAIILRSEDYGDTWATVAEIESASAPESSWGMPWVHQPSGRVYVFYTYNVDDVRFIPNNSGVGGTDRVDSVGVLAYRSSVDGGATWSARSHLHALPATDIDLRNPWGGTHRLFWLSGHPVQHGDFAHLGMSKMGQVVNGSMFVDTEALVVKVWETAPGTLTSSLSAPITCPPIAEEPSPIVFGDGVANVAFRTIEGRQGEAWSTDGGASWGVEWARDLAGSIVPQPRAKAAQFLLPDGRVLLWGHNNNSIPEESTFYGPRNPVFVRIGERQGARIAWGAPRLLLWDADPATRISYPSLVVDSDHLLVSATDKHTARVLRFPLAGL